MHFPPFSGLVAVLSLRLNVQAGLTFGGVVPVDTVHWSGLETPITELHAVGRTRVCPHRDSCVLTWKGAWSPNILLAFIIVFFDLYGHLEGAIFSKKSLALNTAKKDLEG